MQAEKPINILVVDDLPDKLFTYRAVLEDLGQNLVMACSGEEALKLVLRDEYAVILLDVNMPGMDGFETAELIRRRRRSANTPIIFLTAFADEMRTAQGYALGAVDYIPTPVVAEVLRTKVKVFIELFRMREQGARQAEERAKREAAERAARQSDFLARVSASLAEYIELDAFLTNLARLPIPYLADVSVVSLAQDAGRPASAIFGWVDERRECCTSRLTEPARLTPSVSDATNGVLANGKRVSLDGQVMLLEGVSQASTAEPVIPPWVFSECFHGVTVLPLSARGQTFGALLLGVRPARRETTLSTFTLAEDLASRAGIALENALLLRNIQEADHRKDEFLAMLAHELRNPLAPIRNAVQIMQATGPHGPTLQQALEMIDRQASHMGRLIDDLLNVTRIASGKILLRPEVIDLRETVHKTVEDHRTILTSSSLHVDLQVPSQPVWVEGDPTRLAQVLGNLLNNAQKFTEAGGTVSISLDSSNREAILRVADTGIGIDSQMLPRVFDVFVQAEQGLDRGRGGLGLGLALVKGLVDLHGGTVSASSAGPGKGSEFVVRLRLAAAPRAAEPITDPTGVNGIGRRILVVEDNRDAAESTKLLLLHDGHEVRTAHNGADALEIVRTFRPRVILCDIGLPGGMSGYDVIRAMRDDPAMASIYAIALTGYGRDEDQRQALDSGFDLHLTKPVEFATLRRAIAEMRPCEV
jgi:signal transduction histidine kinase/DNA-binding response OmpR family regulator